VLWRIFEVKYLQYIAFKIVPAKSVLRVDSLLLFPCDMMKAVRRSTNIGRAAERVEELRETAPVCKSKPLAWWKGVQY